MNSDISPMILFLNKVCGKIKCTAMHGDVKAELLSHIENAKDELEENGMSSDEAERLAVDKMGDPELLGTKLDRLHRPRLEKRLAVIAAILAVFGIISVLAGVSEYFPHRILLLRTLFKIGEFSVAGFVAFFVVYFFDLKKLQRFAPWLLAVGSIIFIATFRFFGYLGYVHFSYSPLIGISLPVFVVPFYVFSFAACLSRVKSTNGIIALSVVVLVVPILTYNNRFLSLPIWSLIATASFLVLLIGAIHSSDYTGKYKRTLTVIYSVFLALITTF